MQPGTRLAAWCRCERLCRRELQGDAARRRRPGQKVHLAVDAFPDANRGTVESVAPASGSVFSLLPPENATGNFTKIVQRVPVRIAVPADVAAARLLRPGLSVVVERRYPHGPATSVQDGAQRSQSRAPWPRGATPPSQAAAAPPRRAARSPPRTTAPNSSRSSRWSSACSWRSSTSRSSPRRSPKSRPAFRRRADEISWVQTTYLIAEVIMIPLSGFLSRVLSTRWMFAISAGGLHAR